METKTKYKYGQFARVDGERHRVRKGILNQCCVKCNLYNGFGACMFGPNRCLSLIPRDAYFEKV